jgi:hypothetical protein
MGIFDFLFKKKGPNPDWIDDIIFEGKVIGYKFNGDAVEAEQWQPPVFTSWCKSRDDRKFHYYLNGCRVCDGQQASSNWLNPTSTIEKSEACKKCAQKMKLK